MSPRRYTGRAPQPRGRSVGPSPSSLPRASVNPVHFRTIDIFNRPRERACIRLEGFFVLNLNRSIVCIFKRRLETRTVVCSRNRSETKCTHVYFFGIRIISKLLVRNANLWRGSTFLEVIRDDKTNFSKRNTRDSRPHRISFDRSHHRTTVK